jgi:hypothetical protein
MQGVSKPLGFLLSKPYSQLLYEKAEIYSFLRLLRFFAAHIPAIFEEFVL